MNFNITRKSDFARTFRNASVIGKFDLPESSTTENFVGEITLPETWSIGVIFGNSGTGKTTIAKELFPDSYFHAPIFDPLKSTMDCMPDGVSVDEIVNAFNSVGFSSPPSWLKPYNVLSNGQKMRVDLAYSLLQKKQQLTVFDEFTSVVDRTVARIGSFAVQKAVRKTQKRFIAVSCHFDIIDWLMPDWVFDTNNMMFQLCEKKNGLKLKSKYSRYLINQFGTCLLSTTI